jgi:serine/threonine protein phosphatase PrpC
MNEEEKQRIEAAGGTVSQTGGVPRVNGNLNLSRAIGDLKYKSNKNLTPEAQVITAHPDVRVFELSSEDQFFLLACDGVWDVLSNEVSTGSWLLTSQRQLGTLMIYLSY